MPDFDDHVISKHARGMIVREIQSHLFELYGTEVSPDLISTVTDEVLEEPTLEKDWKMAPRTWKLAANQFSIMFGERFTNAFY